jgi:hypothetical protein
MSNNDSPSTTVCTPSPGFLLEFAADRWGVAGGTAWSASSGKSSVAMASDGKSSFDIGSGDKSSFDIGSFDIGSGDRPSPLSPVKAAAVSAARGRPIESGR